MLPDEAVKQSLGALRYPEFELLDVFGPAEIWGSLKDQLSVVKVAENTGPVESFRKTKLNSAFGG